MIYLQLLEKWRKCWFWLLIIRKAIRCKDSVGSWLIFWGLVWHWSQDRSRVDLVTDAFDTRWLIKITVVGWFMEGCVGCWGDGSGDVADRFLVECSVWLESDVVSMKWGNICDWLLYRFHCRGLLSGPDVMPRAYVQKTSFLFCSLPSCRSHPAGIQNESERDWIVASITLAWNHYEYHQYNIHILLFRY